MKGCCSLKGSSTFFGSEEGVIQGCLCQLRVGALHEAWVEKAKFFFFDFGGFLNVNNGVQLLLSLNL